MPTAKKQLRVTQRDIARLSNVSQATVSRVIAGDDRVDALVSERVKEAISVSKYRPDVRARSLRNQRSGLIGLVFKRPSGGLHDDPFFANLASEIMDFLSGKAYHLCVEMVNASAQQDLYDEMLRTRRVDGLILVESEARDQRIVQLQEDRFPFVLIGNPLSDNGDETGIFSVDNDNILAGEIATRHLVSSGYKRVGILAGPRGLTVSEDRIIGYQTAISGRQSVEMIWHSEFGLEAAKEAALYILSSDRRPDALVVLDDFMAMGLVLAARSVKVRIPQELGIVSFNNSSLCNLIEGGLTSVSLNIPEIVRVACSSLLRNIEDKPSTGADRVIVPTQLIVRGSSNRTAGGSV
ncbi:MAG TPA: LacI family DNA-binding transcriptional regulator [Fimbriimonadaceae bacterium]